MRGWVVVGVLLFASPGLAQPVPSRVQEIVEILAAKHPDLAMGGDDQRRELTHQMIEQIVFELPTDGWGWKSADPTRPPSKDAIARRVGAQLLGCDWQNGATRQPNRPVTCQDITGQTFLPVAGLDHLGSSPPSPPPVPPSPPAPVFSDRAILEAVAQLRQETLDAVRDVRAAQERIKKNDDDQHGALVMAIQHVEVVVNEPGWFTKLVKNRYVQMALAAGAVLIEEQVRK